MRAGLQCVVEREFGELQGAKFQNAVGTMVRSRVACTYDLRAQRVVNVVVSES